MKHGSWRQLVKIFFGVCLILVSGGILLVNLFVLDTGFDAALGVLDLFLFLIGLMLVVFAAAELPKEE